MFQVPRSWVRRSWVNWCEKRAGLGERDAPPPFPDHARLTILDSGTGHSVEFPLVFQTASCSQIIQDTSSSVYSPSSAAVFVSSRNAVGEERCVTRHNCCCENPPYKHLKLGYTLSECTLVLRVAHVETFIQTINQESLASQSFMFLIEVIASLTVLFHTLSPLRWSHDQVLLMMVKELKCKLLALAHCDWVIYLRLVTTVMAAAWRIGSEHESELKLS